MTDKFYLNGEARDRTVETVGALLSAEGSMPPREASPWPATERLSHVENGPKLQ